MSGDGHVAHALLLKLATGSLDDPRRTAVKQHLDSCARCREALAGLSEETSPQGVPLTERTQASDPLIGHMLGEYRVLERLGAGAMGVVYRGEQPLIGKAVAIKVMLPQIAADADAVARMIREAQAVNAIGHPNIVDVFSFGRLPDQRPYLVMELLPGESLGARLQRKGPLSPAQAIDVLGKAAAALAAAHAAGVVHRDLKADNLFVDAKPDGWSVTLLDFGLAKRTGPQGSGLTQPGTRMGTPAYMAPEQVRGLEATGKTDIYALGILAYAALHGREPFLEGTLTDVMGHHLHTPVPRLGPNVPAPLADLVAELVEKDPERRPSAEQVVSRLAAIAATPAGPSRKSRRATALAISAMVLVGTGLAAIGGWLNAAEPPPVAPVLLVDEPIPRPAPPPMEVVEVAPPPTPRAKPGWPCARIRTVGKVHGMVADKQVQWWVFIVDIEAEPVLIVTASGDKKSKAGLEKLQKKVAACPQTGGRLEATALNEDKLVVTDLGVWRGVAVEAPALAVVQTK